MSSEEVGMAVMFAVFGVFAIFVVVLSVRYARKKKRGAGQTQIQLEAVDTHERGQIPTTTPGGDGEDERMYPDLQEQKKFRDQQLPSAPTMTDDVQTIEKQKTETSGEDMATPGNDTLETAGAEAVEMDPSAPPPSYEVIDNENDMFGDANERKSDENVIPRVGEASIIPGEVCALLGATRRTFDVCFVRTCKQKSDGIAKKAPSLLSDGKVTSENPSEHIPGAAPVGVGVRGVAETNENEKIGETKGIEEWSKEECCKFVAEICGSERYTKSLMEDEIVGKVLITLSDSDFEKLGFKMGHRRLVMQALQDIQDASAQEGM